MSLYIQVPTAILKQYIYDFSHSTLRPVVQIRSGMSWLLWLCQSVKAAYMSAGETHHSCHVAKTTLLGFQRAVSSGFHLLWQCSVYHLAPEAPFLGVYWWGPRQFWSRLSSLGYGSASGPTLKKPCAMYGGMPNKYDFHLGHLMRSLYTSHIWYFFLTHFNRDDVFKQAETPTATF